MSEVFDKLKKIISKADLVFLKKFYAAFEDKYLFLIKEVEAFKPIVKKLNLKLKRKKYSDYFSKILKYYSVKVDLKYTILFNWWPPINRTFASPVDKFLVLKKNPKIHLDWIDEDIIFNEIVHTISVRQSQKQKEQISNEFIKYCKVQNKLATMTILEEPMAVVIGQMLFEDSFLPEKVNFY